MESTILAIMKEIIGGNLTSVQFYIVCLIIILIIVYKYFIHPTIKEARRCISVIESQNRNLQNVNTIIERLDKNIGSLQKSTDEDFKINDLNITESQKDINEIKNILSQFQGALLYNSRIFNRELD